MVSNLGIIVLLAAFWSPCLSFYFPGLAPVSYCSKGNEDQGCKSNIDLYVNRLNSMDSVIPYEYSSFDFCQTKGKGYPSENLGQVVFGDRISKSGYNINFKEPLTCQPLCTKEYNPKNVNDTKKLDFLRNGIALNYQNHWIIDNMPVTWCFEIAGRGQGYCSTGFSIGCYVTADGQAKGDCPLRTHFNQADTHYVFNHVDITITYHSGIGEDWVGARLLSARLVPRSIKHNGPNDCNYNTILGIPNKLTSPFKIHYTYSVKFEENNNLKWASRWDYILQSIPYTKIHLFSIINSLVIVLFFSGMVAMIILRTLRKDKARYKQIDAWEDAKEEFGSKLVHGGVFCAPRIGMLLSVLLGSGSQIFIMTFITLVFACLGFLSPANRGTLMTCSLVSFVCFGLPGGYVSARIYKMFGGESWKSHVILSSLFVPGVVFSIFFILNLVLSREGSSAAVPFNTILVLLALWFGISVPLTFLGAYLGFKKLPIELPVISIHNQIHLPSQMPYQSIYTRPLPGIAMGGILPFGCIFIQLFFILNSIWSHQIYYMFGFLFIVFLVLVLTVSETAVLLCYFHLRAEDYHWWWRSFLTGGCTAVYFFLYAIHFFYTKLTISGTTSIFLYFGYTFIMVWLFFLFSGTVSFFSCFFFIRKICQHCQISML